MVSFSINGTMIGKGMGDSYHTNTAKNISRPSDPTMTTVAPGSMFSPVDRTFVERSFLLGKHLYKV
jgi:hypothetical protein